MISIKCQFLPIWNENLSKDFVGKDSWTAFHLLQLDSSFVSLPVAAWKTNEGYEHAKLDESKLSTVRT